jgi:hypothetical protein
MEDDTTTGNRTKLLAYGYTSLPYQIAGKSLGSGIPNAPHPHPPYRTPHPTPSVASWMLAEH